MNSAIINWVLRLSRTHKRLIAMSVDIFLCVSMVFLAFYLRTGEWSLLTGLQWMSVAASILFAVPLFVSFGLYRAIFRFAGWSALMAVVQSLVVYGLIYSAVFTFIGVSSIPRTVGLIQPILLFMAIGSTRAVARYALGGGYEALLRLGQRPNVLIYGAGSAGRQLAAAMANNEAMNVIGFIDDDVTLQGSILNGKKIYPSNDIAKLVSDLGVANILLAIPSASRRRRNEILEMVRGTSVGIRTLPGVMDLAQGRVTINDLRELDVEDLLGRDAVSPNQILLGKNVIGKTVLVSGAGGSIGSELCRQILRLNPVKLLLVEVSEVALYNIHRELSESLGTDSQEKPEIVPLLASVQDEARMLSIMNAWRPQTVYHAAAYKHVPLVEHNPFDGVKNNVFGTLAIAKSAIATGVQDFVLISTDKAVRPTNIMGASKRIAEMVLQALAQEEKFTRFSMVRFGNVLGSSGSVVPLFRRQIRNGGPVTITHQDVTRYFMTIPEAAQLVIQASAMASGGEVFVLDMGTPIKIIDLARRMIELSGLSVRDAENPDGDIEVSIIGLRPGEKLYEELLIGENPENTSHPGIKKANEKFLTWKLLEPELSELNSVATASKVTIAVEKIGKLVPEFAPTGDIVDWVHLASNNKAQLRDETTPAVRAHAEKRMRGMS